MSSQRPFRADERPVRTEKAEVVLVSMPFGPIRQPSIGLELLKSSLDLPVTRIEYFNLRFARRIGTGLYTRVAQQVSTLLGEWIFCAALHGTDPDEAEDYFADLDRTVPGVVGRELRDELTRTRRGVEGFLAACRRRLEALDPRVVGFTSTFQQHVPSLALAARLKAAHPHLFLVFGGANCEGSMGLETARQFPFVDAVVSGEADLVFPTLVEKVLREEPVDDLDGVYTRGNVERLDSRNPPSAPRVTDLDGLPYPGYEDFFEQWRQADLGPRVTPRLLLETSRGCWWGAKQHCTFCGLNGTSMAYRSKSARRAHAELSELTRKYPDLPFMVVDNILDMRYFRDLLPELAESGPEVDLFYEVKANLQKDQIRLLRRAGVKEIQPGIESLSDAVLGLMRKGVSALQNIQLLKWCTELGVWPTWYLIWGFPKEPPEEYRRMADLVPKLTHLPPPGTGIRIRLDRFSPNFEQAEELGFTGVEPWPMYRHVYRLPAASLRNLAYYFDYRHRDGRDVGSYTRGLAARVSEWQEAHKKSALAYEDRGEELWIWDLRPAASRLLTKVSGLARDLYLACDRVRPVAWLGENGAARGGSRLPESEVEDALGPLLEQGLMLRDGDRVLSLAVGRRPRSGKPGNAGEEYEVFTR